MPGARPAAPTRIADRRRTKRTECMARIRGWQRWLIVGVVVVAVLAVAGPYVYIHFIEGKAPKRLSLSSQNPTAATGDPSAGAGVPPDGTWKVATGSQAGYRVKEILFGQNHEAV